MHIAVDPHRGPLAIQVSADGGPWNTVASYTGNILISAYATVDLAAYSGQDIAVRFVMDTDYSVTEDGWFIDDVEITGLPDTGLAEAVPLPLTPAEGSTVGSTPVLTVGAGAKAPAAADFYGFRVYGDELCTDLVASGDDVPSGGAQTSWTAPALADGDYWWRAWAGDGTLRTDLSQPVAFTVETISSVDGVEISGKLAAAMAEFVGVTEDELDEVIESALGTLGQDLFPGFQRLVEVFLTIYKIQL